MAFLPPNQQRQSTEGYDCRFWLSSKIQKKATTELGRCRTMWFKDYGTHLQRSIWIIHQQIEMEKLCGQPEVRIKN